ncbi:MAG: hypothetical protein GEU90_00985 [Gemmatimonas sp.]|nr:hypothetical protein [Gemmatimonas sp.]
MSRTRQAVVTAALLVGCFAPLVAQQPDGRQWDDDRVLELVNNGIERRMSEVVDTALQNYSADARGFVYFILDAPELDRQTLVRTDQVAVEVYWRAPNEVRQRIVGLRERRELPVSRLYYYLDRLTVVQDNYGQGIVIADGDNVSDVPHPVGAGAPEHYHYSLVDSLTLRLSGIDEPVQVYEVQVRPRDPDSPAVIGTVFLEAATGALVRMNFTFTPSAYVDPRLDQISVTLENGLWRGRYWLPYEQRLEIRREIPELDLPFGTLIRTRMQIGEYRFNEGVPDWIFASPLPITMAPPSQRESFPFEQPIDAEWRLEGIGQPMEVEEIREEARALLSEQLISGLPQTRLGFGSASDLFRYNRAEGPTIGFGWGLRPDEESTVRLHGGWSFGAEHPTLAAGITTRGDTQGQLEAHLNEPRDVGGTEPSAGLTNSLAALLFGEDWLDPYYASGVRGSGRLWHPEGWSLSIEATAERQQSAELTTDYSVFGDPDSFRTVREIDQGNHFSGDLVLRRAEPDVPGGWSAEVRGGGGRLIGREGGPSFDFGRVEGAASLRWAWSARRANLDLHGSAGFLFGDVPRQELYLLGGRGPLPGYAHRAFGGNQHLLARLDASADLTHPWLRARAFTGVGWTGASGSGDEALRLWGTGTSDGLRPAFGVGLGVFYDVIHVDVARGLGDAARTQLIIEVQRPFWDFL